MRVSGVVKELRTRRNILKQTRPTHSISVKAPLAQCRIASTSTETRVWPSQHPKPLLDPVLGP